MPTYTSRSLETLTVLSNDKNGLAATNHTGWGGNESTKGLKPGDEYVLETRNFSQVTGAMLPDGTWLFHKSDEDLDADHQAWLAAWKIEKEKMLEANRADWAAREARLPKWLSDRLRTFREVPNSTFDADGWGYELAIAELAVMYTNSDEWYTSYVESDRDPFKAIDPEDVAEYAETEGTSGNQHQVAMALARHHREDPNWTAEGTVSALAPLTGKATYVGDD